MAPGSGAGPARAQRGRLSAGAFGRCGSVGEGGAEEANKRNHQTTFCSRDERVHSNLFCLHEAPSFIVRVWVFRRCPVVLSGRSYPGGCVLLLVVSW